MAAICLGLNVLIPFFIRVNFFHVTTSWNINEPYIYGLHMDIFFIDTVQSFMESLIRFTIIIR